MIIDEIIKVASQFVNLYEVKPNSQWSEKEKSNQLIGLMENCGWQKGWPYCASFCEAVWKTAYKNCNASPEILGLITKNLTPSTLISYNNFKKLDLVSKEPSPGSIFFMRKGQTEQGHAGIVVEVNDDGTIITIEGNTSPSPTSAAADREGDGIYKKTRKLKFQPTSGLYLIGFLPPFDTR